MIDSVRDRLTRAQKKANRLPGGQDFNRYVVFNDAVTEVLIQLKAIEQDQEERRDLLKVIRNNAVEIVMQDQIKSKPLANAIVTLVNALLNKQEKSVDEIDEANHNNSLNDLELKS